MQTKLPAGRGYTTSQINLNIVRAAHTKTGPLRCVGAALHVGTSEARIGGPDGKLYAHATTTCAIFESRQVGPWANEVCSLVRPSPTLDVLLAERQNLKGDHREVRLHPPDCRLTSAKLKDRIWPHAAFQVASQSTAALAPTSHFQESRVNHPQGFQP